MKAMHRERAKRYYAKKVARTRVTEQTPEQPSVASEPSETSEASEGSDFDRPECRIKRHKTNDVIIPYHDIKKCVKKALREEREKKGGNGAGYAAAAVGGIGLISTLLNHLPDHINPMRFLAPSDATSCSPTVLPSPLPSTVQLDVSPSINVGDEKKID